MPSFSCLDPSLEKNKYDCEPQRKPVAANRRRECRANSTALQASAILSARYCVRLSDLGRKVNKIGLQMAKIFLRPTFHLFRPFLVPKAIFPPGDASFALPAAKNGELPQARSRMKGACRSLKSPFP